MSISDVSVSEVIGGRKRSVRRGTRPPAHGRLQYHDPVRPAGPGDAEPEPALGQLRPGQQPVHGGDRHLPAFGRRRGQPGGGQLHGAPRAPDGCGHRHRRSGRGGQLHLHGRGPGRQRERHRRAVPRGQRVSRRDPEHRQAHRQRRHPRGQPGAGQGGRGQGHPHSRRRERDGDPQLRGHRPGQGPEPDLQPGPGHLPGRGGGLPGHGLARSHHHLPVHPHHLQHDAVHLLHHGLHPESGDAVRADPGDGYRHRRHHHRGGEHAPALPDEGQPHPEDRPGRRAGGGQPHHPGHPDGHRQHDAHGLRARVDGALHGAHAHRRLAGHGVQPAGGVDHQPLAGHPPAQAQAALPRGCGRRGFLGRGRRGRLQAARDAHLQDLQQAGAAPGGQSRQGCHGPAGGGRVDGGLHLPVRHPDGAGQDAALRQQERVPGHHRHPRGHHPGEHHPAGPRDR